MKARKIVAAAAIAAYFALCAAVWPQTEPVKETPISSETATVAAPDATVKEVRTGIETVPMAEEETPEIPQSVKPQPAASEGEPIPEETSVEPEIQTVPDSIPKETAEISTAQETIEPMSGGMVYVKGFGWIQSEGPNYGEYAEDMYENGNKIGIMG